MKKIVGYRPILILAIVWFISLNLQGQSEYMLKAGFIERFTRFIEWPVDSISSDTTRPFNILVLGKNPFGKSLETMFAKTKIKKRRVLVRYAAHLDTSGCYHMIFIGENMAREIHAILDYTGNKPIITLSETGGFGAKGVMINFFIDKNKTRFEVNQEALRRSGLKVSHLLMQSARII